MDVLMSLVIIADKVKLLIDYIKVVRGLKNWLVLQKQIEKNNCLTKLRLVTIESQFYIAKLQNLDILRNASVGTKTYYH